MAYFHPNLTEDTWQSLSKTKEILNIGSELTRAKINFAKGYNVDGARSVDRALELLDLTIGDPKWHGGGRRELLRLREYLGSAYEEPDKDWNTILRVLLQLDPQAVLVHV